MSIERKHVILGGMVVLLALLGRSAWSQEPSTQPVPATAPGYVDPMLRPPPRVQAPDATQAPSSTPSSIPPAAMPAPVKASKKKPKQATQKSVPLPRPQTLPSVAAPAVEPSTGATLSAPAVAEAAQGAPSSAGKPGSAKKGKQAYKGPRDIVELPATPMLDEEGRQRLDPAGAPMFNPQVRQQRDKNGHPLFDDKGKPVFQTATDQGYDEKGKKIKATKEKIAKTVPVNITKGTLTVDGLIGKAALNYEIKEFKFVYLYAPWIGTVVVSNRTFPGAKEQPKAFDQHTLTVTVEEHQFQVYSEKLILGKKPESAFVVVDRDFKLDTKYPAMGYGRSLQPPYGWPGAKASPESKAYVKPPPLPPSLRPTMLLPACPEGQMRPPAAASKGGTQPALLPCVAVEGARPGGMPALVESAAPAMETPAVPPATAPEGAPTPVRPPSAPPV